MDDRRRERFGRYEILAELGRGAMGVVYKARDPKINRVVAVKTISLAGQPPEEEQEYRERFYREAEAAGRLSHPGIVTIYDIGEEPETRSPYIVMEFVGGQSLDKLLSQENRKVPLETALQLTHELAEALDCAHGQGVVHRDLKPANILLTEDGHAKIADFGVAKLNLANHTLAGRALGTPAYMSPEQLNGEEVDGRSDLFSLGVVLYTILTGYRPFQGNSALTVSYKVVNRDPIPATVLETGLPQGLDYIISRAMEKDPAQRYQRGMEMALDIQDLRDGRELWSKAKQPGVPMNGPAAPPAGKERSAVSPLRVVAPRRLQKRDHAYGGAKKLLEKIDRKAVAVSLLCAGLFLFGLRIARVVRPGGGGVSEKAVAAELPFAGEVATLKTGPVPSTTATTDPPVTVAPAPEAPVVAVNKPKAKRGSTVKRAVAPTPVSKVLVASTSSAAVPAAIPPATLSATLNIEVDHKFSEAHLSIWVDGHLSFARDLEGTDKKRLIVFHRVQGHEIHAMQVQPGTHQVRVQITSGATSSDQTVSGMFSSGNEKLLQISIDRRGVMNLNLD
jgi:serine/threonine-protein kinase